MSRQRDIIAWVFPILLALFTIAFFAIDQAEANGQSGTGNQPLNASPRHRTLQLNRPQSAM